MMQNALRIYHSDTEETKFRDNHHSQGPGACFSDSDLSNVKQTSKIELHL